MLVYDWWVLMYLDKPLQSLVWGKRVCLEVNKSLPPPLFNERQVSLMIVGYLGVFIGSLQCDPSSLSPQVKSANNLFSTNLSLCVVPCDLEVQIYFQKCHHSTLPRRRPCTSLCPLLAYPKRRQRRWACFYSSKENAQRWFCSSERLLRARDGS